DIVHRLALDEVGRHVHALVALSGELDLVGDHLTDRAVLEVRVAARSPHGREGLVEVRPDLAVRTRGTEGVAAGALGDEERLPALRVPARSAPPGAAARPQARAGS